MLGRDNSYGAQDGLVTGGIYRWTRNPQNAMLVVVYACLAFAVDGAATYLLCAAMMAVYILMVLVEEPWLEAIYGERYRRYCARVPRFFNWRRAAISARVGSRRLRRPYRKVRSLVSFRFWLNQRSSAMSVILGLVPRIHRSSNS